MKLNESEQDNEIRKLLYGESMAAAKMKDLKVTTEECIVEIEKLIKENGNYAVLYSQEKYDAVDWKVIASHFKTEKINAYGQPDKIVIEI